MKWTQVAARALMIAALCIAAGSVRAAEDEARVLILNGSDPYLPAYLIIDSAMRARLGDGGARPIVLFSETLDAQRFPTEALEPEYLALLAKKYSTLRIDVVVTVQQPALGFFIRHGKQLWPDARVVHQGFTVAPVGTTVLPPDATGVIAPDGVQETIDLAWRMQPDAQRVVVITGASELDQRYEQLARKALSTRAEQVPVEFLSGLPLPELVARVAGTPAASIVIYLTQFRDRDGRPYTPREVLRAVSQASVAPVYGNAETYVGSGAAAGDVESLADRGRLVAEQVLAALAGGPPDPGRVLLQTPTRCIADARALQRWSLDERRLPNGCDIHFAERSFLQEHWLQIAVALSIIAAQAALIAALFVQRRRRRLAEHTVQIHRNEVAHASRLAVAGELAASIAHEINQPLGAILSNVDTADLLVLSGDDRSDLLRTILADIRRDDLRASEVIRRLRSLLAKHDVEQESFDLNAAVTEVAALLSVEAERRAVTVELRLAPVAKMVGDRIQIQQVLINLLLNAMDAVRDMEEARRTILVTVDCTEARINITIRDRGIGITSEELPKLFDSFYSTKQGGMGLGLSISRTIVEAHGGRIWAQSGPDRGAVFHVEFPTIEPTAHQSPKEAAL